MSEQMTDAAGPPMVLYEISALNAACAAVLDSDRLEEWPGFFLEQCLYKVTTADNHADTQAMLVDRIAALREANIYERQRYRHILAMPLITAEADGSVKAETSFLIIRTMREGQMDVFVAGVYLDRLRRDVAGAWRYAERIVVCDSQRFDTLVAIPL
jgi:anthranilate 1,2-dioxygenase small subunit/terephthalate 1,2-dioxygenase oxygenase component beta subunit